MHCTNRLIGLVAASLACWIPFAAAAEVEKPNLIYIMVDDLGYGDLGCFGQETIQTPHLDRLARDGLKLTDYYASNTVCRPSRLALWTGQHAGHTAIDSNAKYVFQPEDVTVPELLKRAGYAIGGVGKWAMGGTGNERAPEQQRLRFLDGLPRPKRSPQLLPDAPVAEPSKGSFARQRA